MSNYHYKIPCDAPFWPKLPQTALYSYNLHYIKYVNY